MSMNEKRADKIKGALFGFAIGDAMGATTEFMSAKAIKEHYGKVTDILGGGWLNITPGHITDDTQMMLCVARGMMERASFEGRMNRIARNFETWLSEDPIDVGNTCYASIRDNTGHLWETWSTRNVQRQNSTGKDDYGNGGLMRCLVPCLGGDLKLAREQSNLTHTNRICNAAIQVYYGAIQYLFDGIILPPHGHMEPIGHVRNTLNNALYWVTSTNNFEEVIVGAVNDGGDADTIAALAGGLAGTLYGYSTIPERWLERLEKSVSEELSHVATWLTGE